MFGRVQQNLTLECFATPTKPVWEEILQENDKFHRLLHCRCRKPAL